MNNQTAKALTAALQALSPSILSLQNESHMHAGYFEGKESHFKLGSSATLLKNSVWRLAIRQSMPLAQPFNCQRRYGACPCYSRLYA